MTTKIRCVVSNIQSKFTTPGCSNFPRMETSFFNAASCLVGNLSLSITLIATVLPDFLCLPKTKNYLSKINENRQLIESSSSYRHKQYQIDQNLKLHQEIFDTTDSYLWY